MEVTLFILRIRNTTKLRKLTKYYYLAYRLDITNAFF